MQPIESYDLYDPKTAENPFEYYKLLREQAPVYQMSNGMFLVSTYALCLEIIRDYETYSSKFMQKMSGGAVGSGDEILGPETLLSNDPPSHTYFRKLVNKAFSPNRVKKLSDSIRVIADDLVTKLEAGDGKFDAVAHYCIPLPLTVIADQLGVPRTHLSLFKKWSDASIVPISGMASPEELIESLKLTQDLKTYLAERCVERLADPRDDMLSDLVPAEVAGERAMEIKEAVSMLQQFLVAGNETTTTLIGNAVLELLDHPGELKRLRDAPALMPRAIDEVLRFSSPVHFNPRRLTADSEVAGVRLHENDLVLAWLGSANRDERSVDDPDRLDVGRDPNPHLGFGFGTHFCLGASLARLETRIALEEMLKRVPDFRLAGPTERLYSGAFRGLLSVPVEFGT